MHSLSRNQPGNQPSLPKLASLTPLFKGLDLPTEVLQVGIGLLLAFGSS